MIAKNSRQHEPAVCIVVGEEPTTCVYCGTRTELIQMDEPGKRKENCPHCGQRYEVEDEEDSDMGVTINASKETVRELAKRMLEACDGAEPLQLDARETALVVAGLRLLQQYIRNGMGFPHGVLQILYDADADNASQEEIDRLCEKVNFAP